MRDLWEGLLLGLGQLLSTFFDWTHNYGLSIILLTILIRILMIPLSIKQAKTMEVNRLQQEKMRKIKPELDRLKEKHKDDRQKLYEETKKLQDEHGINALGGLIGCLPTFLQFPILFAMYRVLQGCTKGIKIGANCPPGSSVFPAGSAILAALEAGKAGFLGLELTRAPSEVLRASGVLAASPYYLLVVLMGLTMWYQQKQMTKANPADPQMAQMQKMMALMPIMFVFISFGFPSGLTVYWVASNIWTIGQQHILLKRYSPHAGGVPAGAIKSPKGTPKIDVPVNGSATKAGKAKSGKADAAVTGAPPTPSAKNGAKNQAPKPKGSGSRKRKKKSKR